MPVVDFGCPVLHAAVRRRFWMSAIASAVRRRFWMSGVASRLTVVLDARRRSLRFGTGELRSAPALPSGPAPEPLRASPRASSRPRSGTTPSLAPSFAPEPLPVLPRPCPLAPPRTRPEPVPERVVHRVPGRPLLINYRKLWPEICRKAPGIGYFCEKQP